MTSPEKPRNPARHEAPFDFTSIFGVFDKPMIAEFEAAIVSLGGQLLNDRDDHNFDVLDTSARLVLNLLEKASHRKQISQEALMRRHFEDLDEASIIDIRQGNGKGFHIYSILHSALFGFAGSMTGGSITAPLSPKGLIGLSVLAKLPTDVEKRRKIRPLARALVSQDPIAQSLYASNTGTFNGHFRNVSSAGITERVFKGV